MTIVHKTLIAGPGFHYLNGRALSFGFQLGADTFALWHHAWEDPETVIVAMTGDVVPDGARFIGTAMTPDGSFVLHAFGAPT